MTDRFQSAQKKLEHKFGPAPELTLVLGSGLSPFAQELQNAQSLPFSEMPGVAPARVEGHRGELIVGEFEGQRLAVLAGRLHAYEGHSPFDVVFLLRSLRFWGVKDFVLTNAAGATHTKYEGGDLVLISDHLNLTGQNPLVGTELFGGERFPDMSDPYSKEWRQKVRDKKPHLKEGVYAGVLGPSFETAAEVKMLHGLGADLVGMSTVWETIALVQLGARVLGISCVANLGTGVKDTPLTHQEVLESIGSAQKNFKALMQVVIETRST